MIQLEVTFFKTFDRLRHPETGVMTDVEVFKAFEFPEFSCIYDAAIIQKHPYVDWQSGALHALLEYLTSNSKMMFDSLMVSKTPWKDRYTAILLFK